MELWRDVVGYVGHYQVSDEGRVRSMHRLLSSETARGERRVKQILKPGADLNGRLKVALCAGGKVKLKQIHRLVLEAFVGPCPAGLECCHNDGNHTNNRLDNLRWDTRRANRQDAIRHGTMPRGEKSGGAKLSEQDVIEIRQSLDSQRVLGRRYGVSGVTIHHIKARKTWAHI
jgi:hypothetical protein